MDLKVKFIKIGSAKNEQKKAKKRKKNLAGFYSLEMS